MIPPLLMFSSIVMMMLIKWVFMNRRLIEGGRIPLSIHLRENALTSLGNVRFSDKVGVEIQVLSYFSVILFSVLRDFILYILGAYSFMLWDNILFVQLKMKSDSDYVYTYMYTFGVKPFSSGLTLHLIFCK